MWDISVVGMFKWNQAYVFGIECDVGFHLW